MSVGFLGDPYWLIQYHCSFSCTLEECQIGVKWFSWHGVGGWLVGMAQRACAALPAAGLRRSPHPLATRLPLHILPLLLLLLLGEGLGGCMPPPHTHSWPDLAASWLVS